MQHLDFKMPFSGRIKPEKNAPWLEGKCEFFANTNPRGPFFGKAPVILTKDAFFSLPLSAVLAGTKTVLLRETHHTTTQIRIKVF